MKDTVMVVRMSHSHWMALLDVLLEHMRCEGHTERFTNCSLFPPVETDYGDLLEVFSSVREIETTSLPLPGPSAPDGHGKDGHK